MKGKHLLAGGGLLLALAMSASLLIRVDGNLADECSELSFRFAANQDRALRDVVSFKLCYATKEDDIFSERQFRLTSSDATNPYADYRFKVPASITKFRLDLQRRPPSDDSALLPTLEDIRLDGQKLGEKECVPFHNKKLKFSGYLAPRFTRTNERLPQRITLLSSCMNAIRKVPVFSAVLCSRVCWMLLLSVVTYLTGLAGMLLFRLRIRAFGLRFAFANAVGLGLFGWLFSIMALLGAFGYWWLLITILLIFAGSCWLWIRNGLAKEDFSTLAETCRQPFTLVIGVAALFVLASICFCNCNCPPYGFDETEYHLAYAWQIFSKGRFENDLYMRFPFFAHTMHVLYAAILALFDDDILTHYLSGWMLFVISIGLFGMVRKRDGVLTAALTTSLFVFFKPLLGATSTAYIDIPLMFFAAFAIFAVIEHLCGDGSDTKTNGWLYVSAFLIGIDVSVKYQGLLYLGAMLAVVLSAWLMHKKSGVGRKQVALFLALVFVSGGMWYVRNAILAGNPLSPFAAKFFGCWPWSEADHVVHDKVMTEGVKSWQSVLLLPYYAIVSPDKLFQPVPRIAFPVSVLGVFLSPWFRGMHRILAVALPIAIYGWAATSPFVRYAFLLLPFAAWQSVYVLIWLAQCMNRHRNVLYGLLVAVAVYLHLQFYNWAQPFPVREVSDVSTFETLRFPWIRPIRWLNANASGMCVYCGVDGSENLRYMYKGHVIGDDFGPGRYGDCYEASKESQKFKEYLSRHGINYILLRRHSVDKDKEYSFLKMCYSDPSYVIYKVCDYD